jgi:hypothetical protein
MPINPNVPIQTKGGVEANVQAHQAKVRELMISTDTSNLYVGKGTGNNPVLVADSTVPDRVQKLENQATALFAIASDDFANSSKIATNNGLVVANSKIRPALTKYTEDFINDANINFPLSSDTISTNNNYLEVVPSSIGFTTTTTTTTYNTESVFVEPFSFNQATQIQVTPSVTTPTGILGITKPEIYRQIDPTNTNEHLIDAVKDDVGDTYVVSVNLASLTNIVFTVDRNNTESVSWTFTYVRDAVVSSIQAPSDTIVRNVAITTDATHIYVAMAFDAYLRVFRILKSTMVVDPIQLNQNFLGTGETGYTTGIDIEVLNNRLHVIYTNKYTGSLTNCRANYGYRDLTTWGSTMTATQNLMNAPNGTTDVVYSVGLCKSINNQLGWFVLTRKTTSALLCGVIDAAATTSPYQYRNTQVGTNPNTVVSFSITVATSSNGQGTMVYDASNNTFYVIYGVNANTDIRAFRFVNNQTDAGVNHAAITTPAEYSTVGNRDIRAIVESTSNVHIFLANSTRAVLHYVKASFASTFTAVLTTNTVIWGGATTGVIQSFVPVITQTSPLRWKLFYKYSNEIDYVEYKDNIQPEIFVQLLNGSYSSLGGSQKLVNGVGNTFTIGANNNVALRFEFGYPVYSNWWTLALSGKPYSAYLNSYVIEQTSPINSPAGSGDFISTTLISDRIIKEVTFSATQSVGTNPNNNIEWYVRGLSGGTWLPINNNQTLTIPEANWGSSLQVRGVLTYGAGITDITTAPNVDRYEVNVKNTLTSNDILPMQINMLKMGLRLTALTNYTTTSFNKMMIDTFLDQTNIDTANTTALYQSTNQWYTTASLSGTFPKVVTGKVETTTGDGVDVVTSAIFMAEHQGPFAPTYYMRRGTDTWQQVQLGTIINFTSGTPTNQIQWKAELPENCYLLGVAYLYN